MDANGDNVMAGSLKEIGDVYEKKFSAEELGAVKHIRARLALDTKRTFDLDNFGTNVVNGMMLNLQLGELGLVNVGGDSSGSRDAVRIGAYMDRGFL
jgi:hypothetical protein